MATLEWNAQLEQNLPAMDATHREFVDLLAQVEAANDAQLTGLWREVVAHTQAHFDMEDRWMQDTGFAVENCHSGQHKVVLEILRESLAQAEAGDLALVRAMTRDLASWFSYHAQTMDAALAQHLRSVGYDTDSGVVAQPGALPQVEVAGCGGACASGNDHAVHAAVAQQMAQSAIAHAARVD